MRVKRHKYMLSMIVLLSVMMSSDVSVAEDTGIVRNELRSDRTISIYQPVYLDYESVNHQTDDDIKATLMSQTQQVISEKEGQGIFKVRDVILPNEGLSLGKNKVTVSVTKGDVMIPLVEEMEVIVYGGVLKSDLTEGYTLSELQNHPQYLLDHIQTSHSTDSEDAVYTWVSANDSAIDLEEYAKIRLSDDQLFIKMTDKQECSLISYVPIPADYLTDYITEDKNRIAASDIEVTTELPIILRNQLMESKTEAELKELIDQSLSPVFKVKRTGEILTDYTIDVGELTSESLSGTVSDVTYRVRASDGSEVPKSFKLTVLPEGAIDNLNEWENIPLYSKTGVIQNPYNKSTIGFNNRGISSSNEAGHRTNYGFYIRDESGGNYTYKSRQASFIPFKDEAPLYEKGQIGFGTADNKNMDITSDFFLKNKKTNNLKQIVVDKNQSVIFMIDLSLKSNLNFEMMLTMYNTSESTQNIAMLEFADTDYYNDQVPMYTLGNLQGFYMEPKVNKRMSFILRDRKGNWLSDYRHMAPGNLQDKATPDYPYAAIGLNNYTKAPVFGLDFMKPGLEGHPELPPNYEIVKDIDTAYQLGSDYKLLHTDESIVTGYQVFLGMPIDLMVLNTTPKFKNVYADELLVEGIETGFSLTKIPEEDVFSGQVYGITLDNQDVSVGKFESSTGSQSASGTLLLPRNLFPEELNATGKVGIESHTTTLFAINEATGRFEYLESNEETFTLNAYNFGAEAKNQSVKQGSTWNKKAEELLTNKTFLPGHTITYSYVDDSTVDTSRLGIQKVRVRMTDETASKTAEYDVLVNVQSSSPSTTGLTLVVNNFSIPNYGVINTMTQQELDEYVIKQSHAVAWDNATGLSEGIELYMYKNTLKPSSKEGNYTAQIGAQKTGSYTAIATSKITVLPPIDATVNLSALPQDLILGTDVTQTITSNDLKGWVTDVTYKDKPTTDYQVELVSADTSQVSDGTRENGLLKVTVENSFIELPLRLKVGWGNTLAIGGGTVNMGEKYKESMLAYTLHDDASGVYLTTSYGFLPDGKKKDVFDSRLGDAPFSQLSHYPIGEIKKGKENALELVMGPNKKEDVSMTISGNNTAEQVLHSLGDSGRLDVSYGDVLRLYVANATDKVVYNKGNGPHQFVAGLPNDETVFGIVTKEGFKPLYLSHLETEAVPIDTKETESEESYTANYLSLFDLNQKGLYLNIPQGINREMYETVEALGFKSYPELNLSVGQKSEGSVYVDEPIDGTGNRFVKYAYQLDFIGSGPELSIGNVPSTITFGKNQLKSNTQHISQKKEDNHWGFVVNDARNVKSPWEIQMRMLEEFNVGELGDSNLTGAYLTLTTNGVEQDMTTDFQAVYTNTSPVNGTNPVTWTGKDGFSLIVPPGMIQTGKTYSSVVDIILVDAPVE